MHVQLDRIDSYISLNPFRPTAARPPHSDEALPQQKLLDRHLNQQPHEYEPEPSYENYEQIGLPPPQQVIGDGRPPVPPPPDRCAVDTQGTSYQNDSQTSNIDSGRQLGLSAGMPRRAQAAGHPLEPTPSPPHSPADTAAANSVNIYADALEP